MKNMYRSWRHALVVLSIGTLAACGGGGAPIQELELQATGIKTLQLRWNNTRDASGYRLLFTAAGTQNTERVAELPANTTQHTLTAFLPAQVNGRYTLQSCLQIEKVLECFDRASAVVEPSVLNAAIGYFKASNQGAGLGASVSLSSDGHTLAIGAPWDNSDATGIDGDANNSSASVSGAVYVYSRSTQGWVRQAYIKPSNTTADNWFGKTVSLSADGQRLAVAAPQRNGGDGAVYLFERSGSTWAQVAELAPPVTGDAAALGQSLALSADGSTLVVGEDTGLGSMPEAHVYARGPGGWLPTPDTLPLAEPTDLSSTFAKAVAIAGDGNTVLVGARGQRTTPTATAGAAYVYTRSAGIWSLQARLLASNSGDGDDFGSSVALSADGLTLAVGARFEDGPSTGINGPEGDGTLNSGAVYVFTRAGGAWNQQAYVKASNTGEFDEFGNAMTLSADGNVLAVTAIDDDSADLGLGGDGADNTRANTGATYVFQRNATQWRQSAYVKASQSDEFDRFGESVALSGDGHTLAVGSTNEASTSTGIGGDALDNGSPDNGAVYLY